jgi:hypothetical protein
MRNLAFTLLYGVLLIPIAILGIAARVRRVRAGHAQPTGQTGPARPTDWARYDVPTFLRRRTSGNDQ